MISIGKCITQGCNADVWQDGQHCLACHEELSATVLDRASTASYHTHTTEHGIAVKCYHECKSVFTDWKFIIGVTLSFPIEHALWELTPLHYITAWLGL